MSDYHLLGKNRHSEVKGIFGENRSFTELAKLAIAVADSRGRQLKVRFRDEHTDREIWLNVDRCAEELKDIAWAVDYLEKPENMSDADWKHPKVHRRWRLSINNDLVEGTYLSDYPQALLASFLLDSKVNSDNNAEPKRLQRPDNDNLSECWMVFDHARGVPLFLFEQLPEDD